MTLLAAKVAQALKAKRHSGGWIAPCPAHNDRDPSLTIRDGRNGILLHCWSGCTFESIISALQAIGISDDADSGSRLHAHERQETPRSLGTIQAALRIWDQAGALGYEGKRYLQRRGILKAPGVQYLRQATLRHPIGVDAPAIITPRMNERDKPLGIQRTFIDEADCTKFRDGEAKLSLGEGLFTMLGYGDSIFLAEGVENALSAQMLFGDFPAFACCMGFPKKPVELPGVKRIRLIVDHDRHGASQKKALVFHELNKERYEIRQWIPKKPGQDANDVWLEHMK